MSTIELRLGGMTCASCAARIEKRLNRIDGVEAEVNYATETAVVVADGVDPDELVTAVESIGYTAHVAGPAAGAEPVTDSSEDDHLRPLRQRLLASAVLTAPVLVLAMVPRLQFDSWQWLSLTLAAPVVVWAAGRSTGRHGPTSATARRRWTRSSHWAPSRPSPGRCGRCSSATPGIQPCG